MIHYSDFNGTGHPCVLYIRIREIEIEKQYDRNPTEFEHWKPPNSKQAFKIAEASGWLRWTHHTIERPGIKPPNFICDDVISIFWDPACKAFIQGPFDCMSFDSIDDGEDFSNYWKRIKFETSHITMNDGTLQYYWRMGHLLRDDQVTMPMTPAWEKLLSPSYFHDTAPTADALPSSYGFGSRLSLILGLLTLAVTWEGLEEVLRTCFFPDCGATAFYDPRFSNRYPEAKRSTLPFHSISSYFDLALLPLVIPMKILLT